MVRADILDPRTGELLDTCSGADDEGYCPRQDEHGHVPCAGLVLEAEAPEVGWALRLPVAERATTCPLRCFAAPGS